MANRTQSSVILQGGRVLTERGKLQRVPRRPQHRFRLQVRPWAITPFMLAPVLAGETLKNLLCQARVVSQPLKDKMGGWWCELYFFYVPLRYMPDGATITESMLLNPEYDHTPLNAAAKVEHFHNTGFPDYVQRCLEPVVREYFRDQGESLTVSQIGNYYGASIMQDSWLDSVMNAADYAVADVPLDADASGSITAGEAEKQLRLWEFLRDNAMTTMTYEEYLERFGVKIPGVETQRPELIRYVRDWAYPSNTVEPTTGVPTTAMSWSIAERADKDRFFREPGFLFGCMLVRPKVYLANQVGSAADVMSTALSWLPPDWTTRQTSLRQIPDNTGPLGNVGDAAGIVMDVKDLLIYGDEFRNFSLAGAAVNQAALPNTTTLQRRYASATDADNLFLGATAATRLFDVDGVVSLNVHGAQVDTSPKNDVAM